MEYQNILGT